MERILPLIILCLLALNAHAVVRMVSTSGSDVGDCTSSACATIAYAYGKANNGDTINVASGSYSNVSLTIAKSVVLRGNGGAPNTRPVLTTNTSDMFTVEAPNVVIENFTMNLGFSGTSGLCAIAHRSSNNFDGLIIQDNRIMSTSIGSGVNYNAYGIQLYHSTSAPGVTNSVNNVIIRRNVIGSESLLNPFFGRGIMLGDPSSGEAPQGMIGGSTVSQGNTIVAYYAIQTVHNVSAPTTFMRNTLTGEFTVTKPYHTVNIDSNTFTVTSSVIRAEIGAYINVKNVDNPAQVNIRYNRFNNFENVGVFSGGSRNVMLRGNLYTPASGVSKNYICVFANTKYRTTSTQPLPTFSNSISITLDTFKLVNPASGYTGYGVVFANHIAGGVSPAFDSVVLGGSSANSNVFDGIFNARVRAIVMDYHTAMTNAANSPADTNPFFNLWNNAPATPATDMAPCNFVLDATENIFEWTSGVRSRPYETAATLARLLSLEDKIIHRTDYDSLGFVRILPRRTYVTPTSYISLISSVANINNAFAHSEVADGDTVYIQYHATAYNQPTSPSVVFGKSIILKTNSTLSTPFRSIQINSASDTLFVDNDIQISSALTLTNGIVKTNGSATISLDNTLSSVPDLVESTASHVVGRVKTTLEANSDDVDYLGVVLPAGDNLGYLQITRITGDSGITTVGTHSSVAVRWELAPDNNVGRDNAQFRFLPIWLNGKDTATLTVWKQEGSDPWTLQMSATAAATTSPLVSTQPFNITSFSKWTVSDLVNPLPISLLDFTAKRVGNQVVLNWTASFSGELGIFSVEKSYNGSTFTKIGEVSADAPFKIYTFTDGQAQTSAYYRIKLSNGTTSKIVFVESADLSVKIYPTVILQTVKFEYDILLKGKYMTAEVTDASGVIVRRICAGAEQMETELGCLTTLRSGLYFVKFTVGDKVFTQKVIKQ